jgi:hypothetical protein
MENYSRMSTLRYLMTEVIKNSVEKNKIGVFHLGNINDSKLEVGYVGRSDSDLCEEIIQRGIYNIMKKDGTPLYSHFCFCYKENADDAYEQESYDYHYYGQGHPDDSPPSNQIHPAKPANNNEITCPWEDCEYFYNDINEGDGGFLQL